MNPTPEEALFAAALERPAAERPVFLDGACLGDQPLRQRVETLLAAHDATANLLHTAASPAPTLRVDFQDDPPDDAVGQTLGRYKLLEKVGEGGCGVVYVAEQTEPVRRRVALKVIKLGMDTKQVVARFEAERQALALMDHPNIAKVFDAGTTDSGRPFFVMELVRGIPITHYCDQAHLSTHDRLDLFIKVCHAIQHAHQKGIIHRDIKPSNILVTLHDGVPVPKVIDFGIAKATEGRLTDATVYTQLHQFIGTPAYMSPEQAEMSGLDIDTRSDIYALGVLLYELLTGKTPFDAKELVQFGLDAMRKTIREKEPQRPSTRLTQAIVAAEVTRRTAGSAEDSAASRRRLQELVKRIRGDLDWIVMKCLEKDRTRRYETANGLAADLRRHLNDEPVVARPPTTSYRLQRAIRRNKLAFGAGTAVLVALLTGVLFSGWQAIRAGREAKRASRAEAEVQRRLTESEAITAFLTEIFQSPTPGRDGHTVTAAEMLDRAAHRLGEDQQLSVERRMQLQETLAHTYLALHLHREAIPLLSRLHNHYSTQLGPANPRSIAVLDGLISASELSGHFKEMLDLAERRLEICRSVFGKEHPETISAMDDLSNAYSRNNRNLESIRLSEEALRLSRKVMPPACVLIYSENLAASYIRASRGAEALNLLEECLPLVESLHGRQSAAMLNFLINLAGAHHGLGHASAHLKFYTEAAEIARNLLGANHPKTLFCTKLLSDAYSNVGRHQDQLTTIQRVVEAGRSVWEPENPRMVEAQCALALAHYDSGNPGAAHEILKNLEQVIRDRVKDPIAYSTNLRDLSATWARMGALDVQIRLLQEVFRTNPAPGWADYIWLLSDLELRERFQEMLPILQKGFLRFADEPDKLASMREQLSLAEVASNPEGIHAQSVQTLLTNEVAKLREQAQSARLPRESGAIRNLALIALWQGHPDAHHSHCRRLLEIVTDTDDQIARALAITTTLANPTTPQELRDSAIAAAQKLPTEEQHGNHIALLAQAFSAYRQDRFKEAEHHATLTLGVSFDNNPYRACALGIRAMSRWKTGKDALARQDLAELQQRLPRTRSRACLFPAMRSDIPLCACLLHDEANSLIPSVPSGTTTP